MSTDNSLKRTNRATAGNRYRQALATDLDEEEREFFGSTYGGFAEEKDDDDFRDSSSETDESISSSSEHESEPDEVDEPIRERKKRKMVYKEPRAKAKARLTGMQQQQQQPEKSKKKKIEIPPEQRKSTRQSTVEQRERDEEFEEPQRKKYTKKMHKQLTQEQLLKEAMKMEEINLSELLVFQKEEEIRKNKSKRKKTRTITGPTIKTISRIRPLADSSINSTADKQPRLAAPMVEEISNLIPDYTKRVNAKIDNFVVFSSAVTFKTTFDQRKPSEKPPTLCRITGKPARYRTKEGIPYFDSFAFKQLQNTK